MVYELNGKGTRFFTVNTFAFSNTTPNFQGKINSPFGLNFSTG
jgi:hypothetical protein